jgi:hypothetical protein
MIGRLAVSLSPPTPQAQITLFGAYDFTAVNILSKLDGV